MDARAVAAGLAGPPALPGVYRFRDARGALVYVGSSRCLARRVRSYFRPGHAPATKPARIARFATVVEWRVLPSVLEALVDEARTIARERPHFNRRLKASGTHVYVRFDPRDPFPRLVVTRHLEDGPWRYLGPFPGGRRLATTLDELADALGLRTCPGVLHPDPAARACLRVEIGRCSAPCIARVAPGAYGRQLSRAIAALGGGDPESARRSDARSGPLPVAPGASLAGALAALRAARRATRVCVALPEAGMSGYRLLAVVGGRLCAAASAPARPSVEAAFDRIVAALEHPAPALLPRDALDEVRIVTAWLASPAGRAATIDYGRLGRMASHARLLARIVPGPLFSSGDRRGSA